jgi:hypothetical protein
MSFTLEELVALGIIIGGTAGESARTFSGFIARATSPLVSFGISFWRGPRVYFLRGETSHWSPSSFTSLFTLAAAASSLDLT